VASANHERGQLLEFPGRLRALAQERHLLAPRDDIPVIFLIDDDRVRGKAEKPDDLGVTRRAERTIV